MTTDANQDFLTTDPNQDWTHLWEKFNSVADMPVSEEELGAYLEDNLDGAEAAAVEALLLEDPYVELLAHDVVDLPDPEDFLLPPDADLTQFDSPDFVSDSGEETSAVQGEEIWNEEPALPLADQVVPGWFDEILFIDDPEHTGSPESTHNYTEEDTDDYPLDYETASESSEPSDPISDDFFDTPDF